MLSQTEKTLIEIQRQIDEINRQVRHLEGVESIVLGEIAVDIHTTGNVYLDGAANPFIQISEAGSATNYFQFLDENTTTAKITKVASASAADIIIDPIPSNGTSAATVRLFRYTNTSGRADFQVLTPDATGTINHSLAGTGDSYFCANNGELAVGHTTPSFTLDVRGSVAAGGPGTCQIYAVDKTAYAIDVGGAILMGGYYAAGSYGAFGAVKGGKENATSGNYASYLAFFTRANGASLVEQGRFASNGAFETSGSTRALGSNVSGTGGYGMELSLSGTTGYLQSYDRTGSAYLAMIIRGLSIALNPNNVNNINLGVSAGAPTEGFFGTAAIVKPTVTGSRAGNAALASFLTALANLGLIVNSTTA